MRRSGEEGNRTSKSKSQKLREVNTENGGNGGEHAWRKPAQRRTQQIAKSKKRFQLRRHRRQRGEKTKIAEARKTYSLRY